MTPHDGECHMEGGKYDASKKMVRLTWSTTTPESAVSLNLCHSVGNISGVIRNLLGEQIFR